MVKRQAKKTTQYWLYGVRSQSSLRKCVCTATLRYWGCLLHPYLCLTLIHREQLGGAILGRLCIGGVLVGNDERLRSSFSSDLLMNWF